jgi:DNA mismatch repair protein MSH5
LLKSADGAGLFCGLLKSLLNRGTECPKVLAATHFHDLFSRRHQSPAVVFEHDELVSFVHMKIMFTNQHGDVIADDMDTSMYESNGHADTIPTTVGPNDRMTYLYRCHLSHLLYPFSLCFFLLTRRVRVAPGLATNSQAAQCAALFGLSPQIVRRGQWVT